MNCISVSAVFRSVQHFLDLWAGWHKQSWQYTSKDSKDIDTLLFSALEKTVWNATSFLVLHCLNNLANIKSVKYQKFLLSEREETKITLPIFRLHLTGNEAKGVNRCLFALKAILGQVTCSLLTIVGCVYRQSPEHSAVKCFWICHMGRKVDRAIDYENKLSSHSHIFSAPWKDTLQNSLASVMLFSLEIFLLSKSRIRGTQQTFQ